MHSICLRRIDLIPFHSLTNLCHQARGLCALRICLSHNSIGVFDTVAICGVEVNILYSDGLQLLIYAYRHD